MKKKLYQVKTEQLRALIKKKPELVTALLRLELKDFHRQWFNFQLRHKKTLILAARGHGKTLICNIAFCIYKMIENPDIRILITSKTETQAKAFLGKIKKELEANRVFTELYGDWKSDKWSDSKIVINQRKRNLIEATITAMGILGPLAGGHYDMIIADDVCDEINSHTELQRERLRDQFYTTLLPTLEPHGEIHILGTKYHYNDLYGTLVGNEKEPGPYYDYFIKSPAIQDDGTALWPDKFPLQKLEAIKKEAGTVIFNMQYQQNAEMMKGNMFRPEWLRYYDTTPKKLYVYMGIDPAISQEIDADFTAIVVVGLDTATGNIYVLDTFKDRITFKEQIDTAIRKANIYKPIRIGVERVAYQQAFEQELRRLVDYAVVPIRRHQDKELRALKIQGLFENGKIFLRRNMYDLIDELLAFPNAAHDDLFDALESAITLCRRRVTIY